MNAVKLVAVTSAIAMSFVLVACGGGDAVPAEPSVSDPAAAAAQQWDTDDPELTVDEVESMLAGLEKETSAPRNEIQAGSLFYSPNGIFTADALDPENPTEYNEYAVNIYLDTTEVMPYDYGGAESYDALKTSLFPVGDFTPETIVNAVKDSFNRVTGDPAELRVEAVTVARDFDGMLEITVLNGTERDQQSVYYDPSGQFLRVS